MTRAPVTGADLDDWDRMIDTNCRSLVQVARAVLPGMIARGRGHAVNRGSVARSYPYPGGNLRGATCVEPGMQPLTSADIAESIAWVVSQPAHVTVDLIEPMPMAQSVAAFQVDRR